LEETEELSAYQPFSQAEKDVSCFCFRPEEQLVTPSPDLICVCFFLPSYHNLILKILFLYP